MRAAFVIEALALPAGSRVDQRVPKKLLLENGAPTAADKRQITEGVEELFWVAALKPTTIGIQVFRDEVRDYLEIAVLTVTFRHGAKASRLVELIHRAIPYPVVLAAAQEDKVSLSLAHKRTSQSDTGKVVMEDLWCSAPLGPEASTPSEAAFLAGLALSGLPSGNLYTLYQGWIDHLAALEASRITGRFAVWDSGSHTAILRENLDAYAELQRNMAALRSQATQEKQLNRRVALNLEIKRLEARLAEVAKTL